ncbi:F-box protein At1g78280 isoform X1 [Quercus lobata]|uniref:F-box protein At1g78280-like isoform X1 n=1 Tax=Quercus lobata TaxID=97700 RepID=UPI00124598C9|nr:F-box protein At1g78280-like isoform X1 [Quercus lobata]XP_030947099.1 F-box protein At1g78280 isoform X1 [Quercus lobata]
MDEPHAQSLGPRDRRTDALGDLSVLPDETVCVILEYLTPRDVARFACVSSVMYILCNEEPLWMSLCLKSLNGPLQYKGSWKKTALYVEHLPSEYEEPCRKPLYFDGFNSLFLYRRLYRSNTTLNGFSFDKGTVERKEDLSLEEFYHQYEGKKPVLVTGLVDTWPARHAWTTDQLLLNYGDTAFRISQKSAQKILMKFKDYVSYMKLQHDEDPLYIFDDKFGEVAPGLLKDYSVPHLFREDFFDVLDRDERPPFRWLIIGPERSGASWHIDPALTSAWNTLLCGRKRWALYPPGRVPLGVTVHVNDEDGDVNVETPSSLQWWLDFYPLLADEDKPIECTQLPGETIFVPSGWWHCVLNLETTIAVTQNFVNSKNFEFVCLDMAPGYQHKGVCRAGLLAFGEGSFEDADKNIFSGEDDYSCSELTRKEKRVRIQKARDDPNFEGTITSASKRYNMWKQGFSYDINFLAMFLDKERDHYNSPWSLGNCMGQREMREWLSRLWVGKPGMRELIWKGACLALNADKWLERLTEICAFHDLPSPTDDDRLPVGTGSNPVYLMENHVIKIFVEGGLEDSLYGIGTELEFYNLLHKVNSPLKNHIPEVLASGILYLENGSYTVVPWDGKGIPDVIATSNLVPERCKVDGYPFGVWNKKQIEYRKAGMSIHESSSSARCAGIWPYIVTKRCKGKIFAQLRDGLSWEETLSLASFLGEKLHNLHLLPLPPLDYSIFSDFEQHLELTHSNCHMEAVPNNSNIQVEWEIFIKTLMKKRKGVTSRLSKWGDPIPNTLIEKVDEYIPDDFANLLNIFEGENNLKKVWKPCSWIHTDIMDDNIHMESSSVTLCLSENAEYAGLVDDASNGHDDVLKGKSWCPSYILDFSDLSIGDPILDLIPIYLDIFRGDPNLLTHFLKSYKLPFRRMSVCESVEGGDKFGRLSYLTMCYCILHDENILGAIFGIWKELRTAKSWEEVELTVWGELNNYRGFP